MDQHDNTVLSWVGNLASAGAIVTTLLGILPALAALIAVLWYTIQIYESNTIQTWLRNRRRRRLAHLRAKLILLEESLLLEPPMSNPPMSSDSPDGL